jgi:DNA polymerase I-like protein with 3'-5' exonuclease and polymerase domains
MRIPEMHISDKGQRRVSVNREVLERLDSYMYARPFINLILTIRELSKQLEVFETEIDPDGRFRTSYNIAGTSTGRPSSSSNAFGTGSNAQNIAPSLRYVFIPDPGYKLCVIDLEQVEARDVGYFCGCLFDDWTYLNTCESGDLHTTTAKMVWPDLPWTGVPPEDRQIADRRFYRDFSYRDMAKRGGHLSNYMGTPITASRHLKVPQTVMEDFRSRYVTGPTAAFPCIAQYWQWVAQQLQTTSLLVTPFSRHRHFFGRQDDDKTLREAIAFLPQSTTADRMSLGLWRCWDHLQRCSNQIQLLAETYDSITFQYPESADANSIISEALHLIQVPLTAPNGRVYTVPGEAKIGWNWGNYVSQSQVDEATKTGARPPKLNLGGLLKWNPHRPDDRPPPERNPIKRLIPLLEE